MHTRMIARSLFLIPVICILLAFFTILIAKPGQHVGQATLPAITRTTTPEEPLREEMTSTTTYVYGKKLVATKNIDKITYHVQDSLGSNTYTTNELGQLQSKAKQYPYGKALAEESFTNGEQKYLFTGKEKDDNNLYYYGARYYNPISGRFVSIDPLRSSHAHYDYTAGNPLKYIDPDGKRLIVGNMQNTVDLDYDQIAFAQHTFDELIGSGCAQIILQPVLMNKGTDAEGYVNQYEIVLDQDYRGDYPATFATIKELVDSESVITFNPILLPKTFNENTGKYETPRRQSSFEGRYNEEMASMDQIVPAQIYYSFHGLHYYSGRYAPGSAIALHEMGHALADIRHEDVADIEGDFSDIVPGTVYEGPVNPMLPQFNPKIVGPGVAEENKGYHEHIDEWNLPYRNNYGQEQ